MYVYVYIYVYEVYWSIIYGFRSSNKVKNEEGTDEGNYTILTPRDYFTNIKNNRLE